MGLSRRIAFNTGLSFALRIASVALGFFSLGFTTRFLGQEGFGLYSAVLAYAYIASFLGDLGLYSLMVRDISQAQGPKEERFIASNIFTLRLCALLLSLGGGFLVALLFLRHESLPLLPLLIASLQYLFLGLTQVLAGIFQKRLEIKFLAASELFGRVTTLLLLFFFISIVQNASLLTRVSLTLGAFSAGALIIIALNIMWARKLVNLTIQSDFSFWAKAIKDSFPIGLSVVLTVIYFKLDTLLLAFLRSESEAGLYSAAYRILEVIIFFPAAFVGLLMPQLSRFALVDRERFWKFFKAGGEALLITTPPMSVGIYLKAEDIMRFVAGQEFLSAAGTLRLLAGAIFMISFGSLFSNALIAKRKQWRLAGIYFIGAVFNVAANVMVIPRWGYNGAALTTLLTEALVTSAMLASLEIRISRRFIFSRLIPSLISTAIMSIFLLSTNLPLLLSAPCAVIIYSASIIILKGVKKEDLLLLS